MIATTDQKTQHQERIDKIRKRLVIDMAYLEALGASITQREKLALQHLDRAIDCLMLD